MPTPETLTVRALRDRTDGERWDSTYVETYWLPLLGPGSWALLRHLHRTTNGYDGPVVHDVEDIAEALGMQGARVMHSMIRLYKKRLVRPYEHGFELPTLVRRLSVTDIEQLAPRLRDQHRNEYQ